MGPKRKPSKTAAEFERRFLAANPKHATEYATLGDDKVTVQLKLKRVREQGNNKIFTGAVTPDGDFYYKSNFEVATDIIFVKILYCVIKDHPATPVIALDYLLRVRPFGVYKKEVFQEFIPGVYKRKGVKQPMRVWRGEQLIEHKPMELFKGNTSAAAFNAQIEVEAVALEKLAAGPDPNPKGKAPMPNQSAAGSSTEHAAEPTDTTDTNADLFEDAVETPEGDLESDDDLVADELEVLPKDPTPVDAEAILDELEYDDAEVDEELKSDKTHPKWDIEWAKVKDLLQIDVQSRLREYQKEGYENAQPFIRKQDFSDSVIHMRRRLAVIEMERNGDSDLVPDEMTDAMVGFLKPGTRKRRGDLNGHWESSLMQDWPHSDIFEPNVIQFKTAPLSSEEATAKREKFGADIDMFFASTDNQQPTEITGIVKNYGIPRVVSVPGKKGKRDIRSLLITDDLPVCRRNLVRILCIYFDSDALGSKRKSVGGDSDKKLKAGKVSEKQDFMEFGVKVKSTSQTIEILKGNEKLKAGQKGFQAWKPVFSAGLPKRGSADYDTWRGHFDFSLMQHEQKGEVAAEILTLLGKLRSDMTVGEWVTTPFHYEYLPYQPVHAMFLDGETYSAGCVRCSRGFYEHEFAYVADNLQTRGKCRNWPQSWFVPAVNKLLVDAPLPFSASENWPEERVEASAVTGVKEDRGGAWALFEMKLSASEKAKRPLNTDKKKGSIDVNIFKQTRNYAWGHTQSPAIWQGRMQKSENAKVKFGMRDYQLKRFNKFCNCCSDCAAVLTVAPGLMIKNFQGVPYVKKKRGDEVETIQDPWWTHMYQELGLNLHGIDKDYTSTRKDDRGRVMGILNEYLVAHHQMKPHMSKFRSAPTIHVQTDFKFDDWYTTPKKRRAKKDATGQVENGGDGPEKAGLKDALKYIKELLDKKPDETDPQCTGAFRNLLREIQMKYTHKGDLRHDPVEFRKFDKDEYRMEFRNEVRNDPEGPGGTWHNCLRTQQWLPKHGTLSGIANQQDSDYETRIHYATKLGDAEGEVKVGGYRSFKGIWREERAEQAWEPVDSHESTQWGGDADLLEATTGHTQEQLQSMKVPELKSMLLGKGLDATGTKPVLIGRLLEEGAAQTMYSLKKTLPVERVQYRRKQQSRFFITYTLHRASQGPEARVVLERMANGLYAVFGRDDLLSELIVFGQKIVNFKTGAAIHKNSNAAKNKDALDKLERDSYGAGKFGRITKPNKEDKIPEFYANGGGSSYISDTYDTHIHSVDVNAGVEIGPKRHHPHFHLLLTIEHWSVIQIDYFKMRQMLEMLFRGQPPPTWFKGGEALQPFIEKTYHLQDASGGEFMSDAENPWVDIRLYPQDNWEDIIDDYTKKGSGGVIDSALSRLGPAVGRDAVRDLNAQLQASADAANTFQP